MTWLKKFFSSQWYWSVLSVLGLLAISFLVFSPYIPYNIGVHEGELAHETVFSPRYIEFESRQDQLKTETLRQQRMLLVEPIYSVNADLTKECLVNVTRFFTLFRGYQDQVSNGVLSVPEKLRFLGRDIERFIQLSPKDVGTMEYFVKNMMTDLLEKGIRQVDVTQIETDIRSNLEILKADERKTSFAVKVISHYILPNMTLDEVQTNVMIESEMRLIKPFTTIYKEGQPILYKGETVEPHHIEVLKALEVYGVKANFMQYLGVFLISFFLFLLLERFLYHFSLKIHKETKFFVLIYVTFLLVLSVAWLFQGISILPPTFQMEFLVPVPISAMVLCFLVTANVSLISGLIVSVFVTLMFQGDLGIFFYLFMCSAVTTFAMYRRYKRVDLIASGYVVGLFNALFILAIGLFNEMNSLWWFVGNMLLGVGNGVVSAMVSLAVLPYFEAVFKITTSQTLMELSNLSHPLLKQLMMTAPGTYQHSLMVANLAEAGAEAIQADVVLCRTASYFHDVGKMRRPIFFTENQFSSENPHHRLSPRMSKMIIVSHTKDGLDMADNHRLPNVIKKVIAEHHGTSQVSFFFKQAQLAENKNDVDEDDFRYPGPKPSFKESGIVMLADSVEAATRSLKEPSLTKIENLVEDIFKMKVSDGQLDQSGLSLQELDLIKNSFLRIFRSVYHSRLNYQEELSTMIHQRQNS